MRSRELIRILLNHPAAKIAVATSRQDESPRVDALHPSLAGRIDLACEPFDADRVADVAPVAFLGLPHTASLEAVPPLRARGVRVIDLSADYRLKDAAVYADWYGHAHTDPEGLAEAVYGLPELYPRRDPRGRPDRQPRLLHLDEHPRPGPPDRRGPDRADRDHHRRQERGLGRGAVAQADLPLPRVQRELLGLQRRPAPAHARDRPGADRRRPVGAARPVEVIFTPHLVPMDRGILATIYATPQRARRSSTTCSDLYRAFYAASPFVRVVDHLPATKDSAFTNFCDITVRVVRGKILVLAASTTWSRGPPGVAVQNFNLMFGHPETTGLLG